MVTPSPLILTGFAFAAVALAGNFVVVGYHWPRTPWIRRGVDRWNGAVLGRTDYSWVTPRLFLAASAVVFVATAIVQSGPVPCSSGTDDVGVYAASGRQFLAGANPFAVASCGRVVLVPYGLPSVALDAVGSLGGRPGVYGVWLAVAAALLPLLWRVGGARRRTVVAYAATSVLYFPLVCGQIDGANNAIVPVAILAPLALTLRNPGVAGAIAGVLGSAKFPSLGPAVGAIATRGRAGLVGVGASIGGFAAVAATTFAAYGHPYVTEVFLSQIGRSDFSLNEFGALEPFGVAPGGTALLAVQGAILLAVLVVILVRRWEAAPAAGLLLVALTLVTQFLSFNFLLWLLPVAVLGDRARRGLYLVGLLGTVDYLLALGILDWNLGVAWPSAVLATAITASLLALGAILVLEYDPKLRPSPPGRTNEENGLVRGAQQQPPPPPAPQPQPPPMGAFGSGWLAPVILNPVWLSSSTKSILAPSSWEALNESITTLKPSTGTTSSPFRARSNAIP
ncbi:MAG TPA: hypothetical protein VFF67_10845 [Thermoplasmata archaeon]|nr:hypothetical protein [Thermoplasmata archaeon]